MSLHTCELMKCYQACVHDYIHAVDFNPKCELWLRISKLSPDSQVKYTSLTAWSGKLLCCELNAVLQGPDVRVRLGGSETYIRRKISKYA